MLGGMTLHTAVQMSDREGTPRSTVSWAEQKRPGGMGSYGLAGKGRIPGMGVKVPRPWRSLG